MGSKLGVSLEKLYKHAEEARADETKKWKEYLDWFKGEQEIKDRPEFKANTVTNFLFSQLWTMVPILTNRLPEVVLKPVVAGSNAHKKYADFLSEEINRVFHRNAFHLLQQELVLNGLLFGISYFKPTWDSEMLGGKGGIRISVPDTRSVFLEPGKAVKGANYVMEKSAVDRLSLYRQYPGHKEKIDRLFAKTGVDEEPQSIDEIPAPNETGRRIGEGGVEADSTSYIWDVAMKPGALKKRLPLVEGWFWDDTMVEEIEKVEKGKKRKSNSDKITPIKSERLKQKYPTGRVITFVGKEIFKDYANPFPTFPYVPYYNYYIPGQHYSMSEVEQLMDMQEQFNIRQNQIFDIVNHNLGRKLFFGANSGVDKDNFTNRPIECHDCTDVSQIKALDAPNMPGQLFDSLFMIKQNIETISGVKEVTQGSVPGDVRSGAAIDALQEAAQVRLQMKSHGIENTVVELSKFLVNMMTKRYIYKVHYEAYYDASLDQRFELTDLKKLSADDFDYEVKAGANLPSSRFAQQDLMKWMYSEGIIDEKYIVEQMQIEGKDSLIARMQAEWDAKKEAELAAMQPQPPGIAGG
jgi:hypothetical protein